MRGCWRLVYSNIVQLTWSHVEAIYHGSGPRLGRATFLGCVIRTVQAALLSVSEKRVSYIPKEVV